MVWPRSVFVNYEGTEDECIRTLRDIVGHALEREELDTGRVYRCRAFDVELVFYGDHGFEDDLGIELTKYAYYLGLTAFSVGLAVPAFESLYDAMSLFLAESLSNRLKCET